MSEKRIYLSPPYMTGRELELVKQAFDSNFIAPCGPMVDGFESDLSEYLGGVHCAALSSGTAALHLALVILGLGQGDEVICQSFTFAASANPIVYVGAMPVFVDSERETWNMDPVLLEEAIVDRKRKTGRLPGAVIVTHLYGMPAKIDEILDVTRRYGIPLIEDAAEAVGARYEEQGARSREQGGRFKGEGARLKEQGARSREQGGRSREQGAGYKGEGAGSREQGARLKEQGAGYREQGGVGGERLAVGTFGDMGVFSFNGNKIITTSGGGALVSSKKEYIENARFLATQARDKAPHYEHSHIGYNYRMSNVVAAIGRGQLEYLDEFVDRCRNVNRRYKELLADLDGVSFLNEPGPDFYSNYWLTTVIIEPASTKTDREKIRTALESENIESRPLWKPMHMQPVYIRMNAPVYGGSVSEELFAKGLCLPSGAGLCDDDIEKISTIVKSLL